MKKQAIIRAKEWFAIGDNEFGFAGLGLNDEQDQFYAQICFMLQQSIEKYLKGYLTAHDIRVERTHDLGHLCRQCSNINNKFKEFIIKCKKLNKYYIPTRYPTHWQICSRENAKEAYEIAKEIIGFIKKDLKFD
jgi:HEPN domain-containing protein